VHHLATNKNRRSSAWRPWTPKFEELFERGGMDMEHAFNKYKIPAYKDLTRASITKR
jgi:hypothetical protein